MKKHKQQQQHYMPYQAYHARQSQSQQQQQQQQQPELDQNLHNSINRNRNLQQLPIENQQHPTQHLLQQKPLDRLTTTPTTTSSYYSTSINRNSSNDNLATLSGATNAKMSSLTSGNVLLQSNYKLLQQQQQQLQLIEQQQHYEQFNLQSNYNNNYYSHNNYLNNNSFNNNSNHNVRQFNDSNYIQNCNYEQQQLMQHQQQHQQINPFPINSNNTNVYDVNNQILQQQQQQKHQMLLNIKQEMPQQLSLLQQQQQQQQLQQLQYERRQQLRLPLEKTTTTKTILTPTQQQQCQSQRHTIMSNAQKSIKLNDNNNQLNNVTTNGDKLAMDACEIANFLANELFMQQLVSMDGIQSGVPTLTTSTLTPTTLRNIEETFIQLTSEPIHPPFHAGFKPPSLANFSSTNNNNSSLGTTTTSSSVSSSAAAAAASSSANSSMLFNGSNLPEFGDITTTHDSESEDESQSSWNAPQFNEDNSLATTENSSGATDTTSFHNGSNGLGGMNSTSNASSTNDFTSLFAATPAMAKHGANNNNNNNNMLNNNNLTRTTPRRGVGGRRPTKPSNMSPEEEEKRRIRRERNKEAAARCRKRRVDQTNELLEEVAVLEKKREAMQKDIESLNVTKQELEYILEAHRPSCQKVRNDILTVNTFGGLIAPTTTSSSTTSSAGPTTTNTLPSSSVINNNNSNNNNSISILNSRTLGGGNVRSMSPIDIKPVILHDQILNFIKNEPLESALDSNSSLDHDGPTSPKRQMLASSTNPMIPPPLPLPNVASITASLNTPNIVNNSSVSSFAAFNNSNATLNTLNALNNNNNNNNNNINNNNQQHHNHHHNNNSNIINKFGILGSKPRPNSLPTVPRHLALNVDGKQTTTTDINGVAIQTPSTGVFNFDSLMDGGTGLTPVSGPLIPTCSSQNKHPLELTTPTSEPSKLVSL